MPGMGRMRGPRCRPRLPGGGGYIGLPLQHEGSPPDGADTRRGMGAVGYLLDRAEAAGGRIITNDNLDTDNDSSHLGAAFLSEQARMEMVKLSERICAAKEQHRRQGRCGLTPTYLLEEPAAKYLPIPRLFALVEAIVTAVGVCLSLTVEQAASTMAVTAVLTGETAHYKTKA